VLGAQDRRNLTPFLNHAGFNHQAGVAALILALAVASYFQRKTEGE
jgi:hypothetical protein